MESVPATLVFLINWGWLRIGPYIHISIDPVLLYIGPLALHWYGLMYVVAIVMGLWLICGYTARQGITQQQVYRMLWWCVVAGLLGGRLYFVIQQPDLVQDYLLKPQHILATWEGGMAFYGAVFLIVPVLFWRALKERLNPPVVLDAGALFAACAQPFWRIGNLINGDIIGYPSTLPWSTVYDHSAPAGDPPPDARGGTVNGAPLLKDTMGVSRNREYSANACLLGGVSSSFDHIDDRERNRSCRSPLLASWQCLEQVCCLFSRRASWLWCLATLPTFRG